MPVGLPDRLTELNDAYGRGFFIGLGVIEPEVKRPKYRHLTRSIFYDQLHAGARAARVILGEPI